MASPCELAEALPAPSELAWPLQMASGAPLSVPSPLRVPSKSKGLVVHEELFAPSSKSSGWTVDLAE